MNFTYQCKLFFKIPSVSGVCYRFFSEADFKALEKFSTPEIQRVPLDSIVLQMVSMGLPDVRKFPFIEPPPIESLEESVMVLKAQDALNPDEVCITKCLLHKYRQSSTYAVFRDSRKPCKQKTVLLEERFSTKTPK